MAPFWRGREEHWRGHEDRWRRHEEHPFRFPPPPPPFISEVGEAEDEYHRPRRGRYQGRDEIGYGAEESTYNGTGEMRRRTGRWVRHHDRIILFDV